MMPRWIAASIYQFAAGAAAGIGLIGVTGAGRDVWLGLVLLALGALFAVRSVGLNEVQRGIDAARVQHEFEELRRRLPSAAETTHVAQPSSRLRRWLSRFGG